MFRVIDMVDENGVADVVVFELVLAVVPVALPPVPPPLAAAATATDLGLDICCCCWDCKRGRGGELRRYDISPAPERPNKRLFRLGVVCLGPPRRFYASPRKHLPHLSTLSKCQISLTYSSLFLRIAQYS